MNHRIYKKRALEAAGIVHAAGWIKETDKPAFDKLVAAAKLDVDAISDDVAKKAVGHEAN